MMLMKTRNETTISDEIFSSKYYAGTDDSLKDEDNVAWVMRLPKDQAKEWITYLEWVRIPDRLLERDSFQKPKNNDSYSFKKFMYEWKLLRRERKINDHSKFAKLFEQVSGV